MIKISIIHPSRGRSALAKAVCEEWSACARYPEGIEYFIGADENDVTKDDYKKIFENMNHKFASFELSINPTTNIIQCINFLATKISPTTELILSVSDDQGSEQDWDVKLLELLNGVDNFKTPKFIGVDDGMHPYGNFLYYIIVNRAYYNKFGHLLYPEYDGCYGDDDICCKSKAMGCVINAPHIKFQHRHHSLGMTPFDATYAKHNNVADAERNHLIFIERQKRNFDIG